jgi:aminopeptidase YwaD
MDIGEKAFEHVRYLSETIGSRPVGTPSNEQAALYIENLFRTNLDSCESQEFDSYMWEAKESFIQLNNQYYPVYPHHFTTSIDMDSEIVPACTEEELIKQDLENKIVIIYGDLTSESITPKNFKVYNPERHQNIVRILEEKKPSAIIAIQHKENWNNPIFKDWDFLIPSCSVPPSVGRVILLQKRLRLAIHADKKSAIVRNVVGRKYGRSKEKIVIMAHFDTYYGTKGAFDNASGAGILLTLAEEISSREMNSSFEFIAFNSEEYQAVGDQVYLNTVNHDLSNIKLAINIDGAGIVTGTNTITTMGCSDPLTDEVRKIKEEFPGIKWSEPWFESNHSSFFFRGVPTLPLNAVGGSSLLHQKEDTIEHISAIKLKEMADIIIQILLLVDDRHINWF